MAKCEFCGKEVKTTQGLRGHMTFIHGVIGGGKQPVARLATEDRLVELEGRVDQVEVITEQLTDQVGQLTEHFDRQGEQLASAVSTLKDVTERVSSSSKSAADLKSDLDRVKAQLVTQPTEQDWKSILKTFLADLSEEDWVMIGDAKGFISQSPEESASEVDVKEAKSPSIVIDYPVVVTKEGRLRSSLSGKEMNELLKSGDDVTLATDDKGKPFAFRRHLGKKKPK